GGVGCGHSFACGREGAGGAAEEPVVDVDRWVVGGTICFGCGISCAHFRVSGNRDCVAGGIVDRLVCGGSFWIVFGRKESSPTTASDRTAVDDVWHRRDERARTFRVVPGQFGCVVRCR